MSKECANRYKLCREASGLTQEYAAELLNVSVRVLSDYENIEKHPERKVPDEVVEIMADVYKVPLLAWWHLKATNPLGRYLPEFQIPETFGDMAFQSVLAGDELAVATNLIKKILSNGRVDESEWNDFIRYIDSIKHVCNMLFSITQYAEQKLTNGENSRQEDVFRDKNETVDAA